MIKQVLAFAALFGTGLGLLLWLDRNHAPQGSQTSAPPELADAATLEKFGVAPGWAMVPSGRFHLDQYSEESGGRAGRKIEFNAEGSRPGADGKVELEQLSIFMYDPETGEKVVDIRADHGSAGLLQPGGDLPQVGLSKKIDLQGVTVGLLRGSRLVPLKLTSDELSGDLEIGRFTTPGRAQIVGNGIAAEGDGLVLDESQGRIAFAANANTTVASEGGQPGRLACTGPLTIQQLARSGSRPLRIEASQGALLAVEGPSALSLEAREISIDGRIDDEDGSDEGGGFRFERLASSGEVELRAAGHTFRTQSATFELSPEGELELAVLSGSPYALLRLPDETSEQFEGLAAGSAGPLEGQVAVWGQGPMTLTWGAQPSFLVAGPAELEWRGAKLWAGGGLSAQPPGLSTGGPKSTAFRAWTEVELKFEGWRVSTDSLKGKLIENSTAGRIELETTGHSRINGNTAAGQNLELLARDGFDFEYENGAWIVPQAREVDFELTGGDALSGHAARLVDFDPLARRFTAHGDVEVHSGNDYLTGDSVEVLGLEDFTLIGKPAGLGSESIPVRFESRTASIVAMQVERRLDALEARGTVISHLESPEMTLDLYCEALSLSGRALIELESEGAQASRWETPVLLLARGAVSARASGPSRNFSVDAQTLRLLRTPLPDALEFRSDLQARVGVNAVFKDQLGHYKLEAAEFDAVFFDPFERPESIAAGAFEADGRGSLSARGEVQLEKIDTPPLTGRGHSFELDSHRVGRLLAKEGARVETSGYLPGTGEPFSMTASSFQFSPERLVAEAPDIVIIGKEARPAEQRGAFALKELKATARHMDASESAVTFTGNVAFVAHTPEADRWTLSAGLARFDHASQSNSLRGTFDRLVAEQRVRLNFSNGADVSGDYLTANTLTGLVRVEGTPATIFNEFLSRCLWFEIDTRNHLLRSGPGYVDPNPVDGAKSGSAGADEQKDDAAFDPEDSKQPGW